MIELSTESLIFIFFITFIGETYGSIFGGGGFLIQPALLAAGVPPHIAIATDVTAAAATDLSNSYVFYKEDKVRKDLLCYWLPAVTVGALSGVVLLGYLPVAFLERFIALACVFGAFYMLMRRTSYRAHKLPRFWQKKSVFWGICVGVHLGISGAGTGTFCGVLMLSTFGLKAQEMLGTRAVALLFPGLLAGIGYYLQDFLHLQLLAVMVAACLPAGYVGAHLAVKMNEKLLRVLFLCAVIVLAGYGLAKA